LWGTLKLRNCPARQRKRCASSAGISNTSEQLSWVSAMTFDTRNGTQAAVAARHSSSETPARFGSIIGPRRLAHHP
jgi:hypothetical protein